MCSRKRDESYGSPILSLEGVFFDRCVEIFVSLFRVIWFVKVAGFTTNFYYSCSINDSIQSVCSVLVMDRKLSFKMQPESSIENPFSSFFLAGVVVFVVYFIATRCSRLSDAFQAARHKNIVFNSFDVAFVVLFSRFVSSRFSQLVTSTIISNNRQI